MAKRTLHSENISSPNGKSNKRARTSERSAAAKVHDAPFRFLELPPELRDIIYCYVAQYTPAYLDRRHRGQLITTSDLSQTNKQIRQEFTAALYQHATPVTANVLNFDFRHIVTYFNRLTELELKTLPDATKLSSDSGNDRKMEIHLTFTQICSSNPGHHAYLNRWLKRCRHPTKKGTNVRFSYFADKSATKARKDRFGPWNSHYDSDAELAKITAAVRKALDDR